MARRARIAPGEIVYHVLNRANGRNELVNGAQTAAELEALRKFANRRTPYGSEDWRMRIANMLHLEFTLHPRGRTRKEMR